MSAMYPLAEIPITCKTTTPLFLNGAPFRYMILRYVTTRDYNEFV